MFHIVSRVTVVLLSLTIVCLFVKVEVGEVSAASFNKFFHSGKSYKLYVPSTYDSNAEVPLVVMLHGCTQDADQFAAGTEMNQIAENENFIVLYPEQPSSANTSNCWNWFEPHHQERGSGEPSIIAGMVQNVKSEFSIEEERVYVTGLSAGGAMSVIMGATYPDVFTAIGIASGLEYKAAVNSNEAFSAMMNGGPNPEQQGQLAYEAMGSHARIVPVIVFHGTNDFTVRPINGDQVITQWIRTNNLVYSDKNSISETPSETIQHQVPNGRSYTQYIYKNTTEQTILEKYVVQGMGHAWSGGSYQGSYTDPNGPNASERMWNFFKSRTMSGGETDPDPDDPDPEDPEINKPTTVAHPRGGEFIDSVTVELNVDREGTTYYTIDGTEPTKDSFVYTEPIVINKSTVLKFFTVDENMIEEDIKTEEYTIIKEQSDNQKIFIQSEESGFVGRLTADGLSNRQLKVGDKGMYNTDTFRTILSFDTSSLSDQTIKSAKLVLFTKTSNGTVNKISIDSKEGYFGSSSKLEQQDFLATTSKTSVASISSIPTSDGGRMVIDLPSDIFNQVGLNQLRLQAETVPGFNRNLIEFYKEENPDYAPYVEVELE
ncbi:PHB depolymerase family esterase [Virgibacillus sp. C22-A2]|uniref:PHB depolymerase family esterase n=1 Tax=Virgibacillus tibetensis TaxID=3042313 RepID=A0ABU6KCP2_9BACI|nr:PHB depolymerase family esterase [Virgibacillus sp. C22-A2]